MTTTTQMTPGQAEDAVLQLTYDIVDIARAGLGVSEGEATRMASAIVRGLRQRYGGVRLGQRGLYIPAPGKEERNAAVRREFDGTNGPEVMRRHGIKRSTLYAIVGQRNGSNRNGIGGTGPAVQAAP